MRQLRREEREALAVRAGLDGILQLLPVEVGEQVQPGHESRARRDPDEAEGGDSIAETHAKDIPVGQMAESTRATAWSRAGRPIDPPVRRHGHGRRHVHRGAPKGARPDLSVDGTIELERLDDVVFVGRPAFGQEQSTVGLFKLDAPDGEATRTQVKLGRSSVNTIEVVEGLKVGDQVILSDMSHSTQTTASG